MMQTEEPPKTKDDILVERKLRKENRKVKKISAICKVDSICESKKLQNVRPKMKKEKHLLEVASKMILETSKSNKNLEHVTDTKITKKTTHSNFNLFDPMTFERKLPYFSHLRPFSNELNIQFDSIPDSIIKLGLQLYNNNLSSDESRFALLSSLHEAIYSYAAIEEKHPVNNLESQFNIYTNFLEYCHPLLPSQENAIRNLKNIFCQSRNSSDAETKQKILKILAELIYGMNLDREAIVNFAKKKIYNNDVILTYGWSPLICKILIMSWKYGTPFRVIIVDSHPKLEGRKLLKCLLKQGIHCTYILITAVSLLIKETSKVLLAATALLANGSVMSHVGSAQIALLAHVYNVPVLVCCETYKFCERVQTDSIVYNELGDPKQLIDHVDGVYLFPVNLQFDVTPPVIVTAVITEKEILPCTSVPVVLRVQYGDSV